MDLYEILHAQSERLNDLLCYPGAGVGNIEVVIVDAHGHKDTCKPRISKTTETTYYVEYMAKEVGRYSVHIYFAGKEIPLSPYTVNVGARKYSYHLAVLSHLGYRN